mgnify:CR=1 FL=1
MPIDKLRFRKRLPACQLVDRDLKQLGEIIGYKSGRLHEISITIEFDNYSKVYENFDELLNDPFKPDKVDEIDIRAIFDKGSIWIRNDEVNIEGEYVWVKEKSTELMEFFKKRRSLLREITTSSWFAITYMVLIIPLVLYIFSETSPLTSFVKSLPYTSRLLLLPVLVLLMFGLIFGVPFFIFSGHYPRIVVLLNETRPLYDRIKNIIGQVIIGIIISIIASIAFYFIIKGLGL